MLRRNARLRREYIYRKSLEGKERTVYEKKRKLKALPTFASAEDYAKMLGGDDDDGEDV